ncbi:GEVED domain-containing protein [Ferruginibacter sp. SUN106]|uniref:GEVED domain-containing protein n=1 Tax=Ferruginibacter sp. SUN106 TaxID=2978348 RepID=UPI003D35C0A0
MKVFIHLISNLLNDGLFKKKVLILLLLNIVIKAGAQNLTGNPWQSWVPELSSGTETPKAAFAYTSTNGKLTATINNTCESYGIGNDKRGYVYYGNNTTSLISCVDPATETVVSTFGYTSGGAKIASPHSFKSFYVAATNKHYLVISNVGASPVVGSPGTINTDGIVTILDVTNPAAMVFEKNIVIPSALATGSRATGMDMIQSAYTSAGVALYIVVDNLRIGGFGGGLITIIDPLNAVPAISVFLTRDGLGNTIFSPHGVVADAINSRLYVSGSSGNNFILSFTLTGTPTYNMYKILDGDGTEPTGIHTLMLNKAGTLLYGGSMFDAGGNRAYMFTTQADKTLVTAVTINQTAKSAVLNYSGSTSGNVMGVNLLPDGSKLYGVLESNGAGNTAKIYDLDPITLVTNTIVKNKIGNADATFGYLDPHSYAFTLQDFGDAPASYGAASHFLANDDFLQDRLRIGTTVDGDSAIVFSSNFDGDDLRATPRADDEDGITPAIAASVPGLYYGMTGTFAINGIVVQNSTLPAVSANLVGWIDFNHDGVFQSTEGVSVPVPNGTTSVNLSWTIPVNVSTGPVFLRLRISSDPGLTVNTPSSAAFDGEVEDHKFPVPVAVSGTVFSDVNYNSIFGTTGVAGSGENGTTAGVPLYAYLIIGGIIVDSAHVTATGTYNFPNAPQNAGAATIVIGTNNVSPGSAASGINNMATNPPAGWAYTGSSAASVSNGNSTMLSVNLTTITIANQNFGLEQLPDTDPKTQTVPYPTGGTIPAGTVTTAVSGTDFEDGILGNSNTIVITNLPTNATVYYNGIAVTANQQITGFNPALLSYTGITLGSTSVTLKYAFLDAAGKQDPTPADYTLNWLQPLPITLESFTATKENNKVRLLWKTLTEQNVSKFVLEYSTNGATFTAIAEVTAKNSNSMPVSYSWLHNNAVAGNNYYKLKMVDVDGKYMYSNTNLIKISNAGEPIIMVYPNPVQNVLTILLPKPGTAGTTLNIYSNEGKLVYAKATGNVQTIPLQVHSFATGIYYIRIIENGKALYDAKFVKR